MRRLGQPLWRVILFALLGLATTVAVAWGLAFRLPERVSRISMFDIDIGPHERIARYSVEEYHAFGMVRRHVHPEVYLATSGGSPLFYRWYQHELEVLGETFRPIGRVEPWGVARGTIESRSLNFAVDDARGWPFPALWSSWSLVNESTRASPVWAARLHAGIRIGPKPAAGTNAAYADSAEYRALPLRPVWRGLAANTAIYAVAWGGVVGLVRCRRDWRRRRGGLCGACGYDLRGDVAAGCPECGLGRPPSEPRA